MEKVQSNVTIEFITAEQTLEDDEETQPEESGEGSTFGGLSINGGLGVRVRSENFFEGAFYVKAEDPEILEEPEYLQYHLFYRNETNETKENDFCIINIDSVEGTEDEVTVPMFAEIDPNAMPKYYGTYRDILTFTVEIDSDDEAEDPAETESKAGSVPQTETQYVTAPQAETAAEAQAESSAQTETQTEVQSVPTAAAETPAETGPPIGGETPAETGPPTESAQEENIPATAAETVPETAAPTEAQTEAATGAETEAESQAETVPDTESQAGS